MNVLVERLRSLEKSLSRMTAERLEVLAEIAMLDAEDGASERQTASRVARITSTTPKQAAGEVAMAKQVAALPGVADAHANGEISNGQLSAVAAIAAASSEEEALTLAKTGTSSQLQQRAAASRGKLCEERRKAQTGRYLAFKPEEDGQSTRIHGRLPFAESKHLEMQLRKIADRLGLRDKERPSPSARMADALLILTKHNPSQALHDHEEQATQQGEQTAESSTTSQGESNPSSPSAPGTSARPKLYALKPLPSQHPKRVIDYDEKPFPETETDTGHFNDNENDMGSFNDTGSSKDMGHDNETGHLNQTGYLDDDGQRNDNRYNHTGQGSDLLQHGNDPNDTGQLIHFDQFGDTSEPIREDDTGERLSANGYERSNSTLEANRQVVVQRADTRVIIHWNAQSGEVNYENGPPIDHPRLMALLCDARIDIQHCDVDGLPTGLISTAHHSTWRQDRYLAFRDGPCRVPECEGIGKTQAHHIFEDRIDRVTSVEYMINVCNHCHGAHHDGKFTITGKPEQTITFTYKDGTKLSSTARPLPSKLKQPKPLPLNKHQTGNENAEPFAKSA